jgi:hypothetical protein
MLMQMGVFDDATSPPLPVFLSPPSQQRVATPQDYLPVGWLALTTLQGAIQFTHIKIGQIVSHLAEIFKAVPPSSLSPAPAVAPLVVPSAAYLPPVAAIRVVTPDAATSTRIVMPRRNAGNGQQDHHTTSCLSGKEEGNKEEEKLPFAVL